MRTRYSSAIYKLFLPGLLCLGLVGCSSGSTTTVTSTQKETQTATSTVTTTMQQQQNTADTDQAAAAAKPQTQSAPQEQLVDCNMQAHYTQTVTSARNMTCQEAVDDLKTPGGNGIQDNFQTGGGFDCQQTSGGMMGGQFRCEKGSQAYRFDFAD